MQKVVAVFLSTQLRQIKRACFFSSLLFITFTTTFFAGPVIAGDITLPSIGSDSSSRFTQAEEKLLGETFMRQVRLELPVSDDPEMSDYIRNLGYQLVASSEFRSRDFTFFIIQDPNINAFAGPNGHIGMNAGLILTSTDESEVASVMAHEIAHVAQRHLERSFDRNENMSLPTAAAILTAIVLGSIANVNVTEAAIFATMAASSASQLSFSRANELEADHIGIQILSKSGFDPNGMPSFFEKLQQANRESTPPEYLSTHPVTLKRVAESRNRASIHQSKFNSKYLANSQAYYLVKAKLRVTTSHDLKKLVKRMEGELEDGSYQNKVAQLYGYAHALMRIKKLDKARQQVDELIKLDGNRIQYTTLRANIEIEAENFEAGYTLFKNALQLNPGNATLSLHYADSLINQKHPAQAMKILNAINLDGPTPIYLQLLAKAEENTGNQSASHRTLAEYYLMYGLVPSAISHLNQALKEKDVSENEQHLIHSRIREIKEIAILAEQF